MTRIALAQQTLTQFLFRLLKDIPTAPEVRVLCSTAGRKQHETVESAFYEAALNAYSKPVVNKEKQPHTIYQQQEEVTDLE